LTSLRFWHQIGPAARKISIKRLYNATKTMHLSDSPDSLIRRGQASILRKLKATRNIREKNSPYLPV